MIWHIIGYLAMFLIIYTPVAVSLGAFAAWLEFRHERKRIP